MEPTNQNEKRQIEPNSNSGDFGSLILFNQNSHFAYIHKKTEKLVTAVYMITNFIKDTEPLKWKIRENALELMKLNIAFNTVSLSERRDLIKRYQALSIEIVSLSSIAHHSGLISEMNFHILSREFNGLVLLIEKDENKKASEETVVLHPGFFDVIKPQAGTIKDTFENRISQNTTGQKQEGYKGHSIQVSESNTDQTRGEARKELLPLKDIKNIGTKHGEPKCDRQAIILKLLSKKSGLNIKDFAESIKGVSAKTIQRELLSMVASGVLKKEGERRWSTYSLAS